MTTHPYPTVLDRADLPAVVRSVRCPRPVSDVTRGKEPERDILKRLAELAGDGVAEQISEEFGGRAVYIRRTLEVAARVRCRNCLHAVREQAIFVHSPNVRCGVSGVLVGDFNWRICRHFRAPDTRSYRVEPILAP